MIPFEEIGLEIAAMVGEPRAVYPWDTHQPEQLLLSEINIGKWLSEY